MPLNIKQARQEIQELRLPDFFVELFKGERTLRELGLNAPQQIFNLKNLARPYRVIPLFEYRDHTHCCEQHPEGPRFIAFDIQQPDHTAIFGKSFQCVLAMLFIDFWQDERNDIVLPMLAEALEFDRFDELLQEIIDGEHRVLVFSQFVSMLSLLKEKLNEQQIEFCYLDGATTNRGEVVEKFQRGSTPVFLISLKAGGVGLNLTGADTVIHFDPWWNPAVEDQATDRAHRIGQTRVVTSYKLITRGTVEEKILALQQRKRAVIKATLGGEESLVENLTWEEIQGLFE
jgi:SNF2 family DNA or RNA helicase